MARPIVSATTELLYSRLPAEYRAADEAQADGPNGYPLLRYLALTGDQLDEVRALHQRIDYVAPDEGGDLGDTSDLVDPDTADTAWLPWIAQLVGVDPTGLAPAETRAAIRDRSGHFDTGSVRSLLATITSRLADPQRVELIQHLDDDVWRLGVLIHPDDVVTVSWDALEAGFPDWGAIEAAGSWEALGDVDPLAAATVRAAKPAGIEIVGLDAGSWAAIETLGSWAAIETLGSWDALADAPF